MSTPVTALLSVAPFEGVPGIGAFARRVDMLSDSVEVLDRAWRGAVGQVQGAGNAMSDLFPDWEVLSIRWASFSAEVREFVGDSVRWFRASAQDAVEHLRSLVLELDEFLGITAAWTELREWILRELRSFRGGRTFRERLDNVEKSAGATLVVVGLAAAAGLGVWAWWEWKKKTAPLELAKAGAPS